MTCINEITSYDGLTVGRTFVFHMFIFWKGGRNMIIYTNFTDITNRSSPVLNVSWLGQDLLFQNSFKMCTLQGLPVQCEALLAIALSDEKFT